MMKRFLNALLWVLVVGAVVAVCAWVVSGGFPLN